MIRRFALCAFALILLTQCDREQRSFREKPITYAPSNGKRLVGLIPGPHSATVRARNPYEHNAYAISEGKRLFTWYNCAGCHANGGGGMGPALMDDQWIYGSDPRNIFATIIEGRPNGMPSFRGRIPDYQVWQLVAYVQSLSGMVPKDAANGRDEHMFVKKPDAMTPDLRPRDEPARHP